MKDTKIVGRTNCPECGFGSAHTKRSTKVLYRFCPECGSQHMAKTPRQEADLLAKTRMQAEGVAATASASATTASAEAVPTTPPVAVAPDPVPSMPAARPQPAAQKRRGLFS